MGQCLVLLAFGGSALVIWGLMALDMRRLGEDRPTALRYYDLYVGAAGFSVFPFLNTLIALLLIWVHVNHARSR